MNRTAKRGLALVVTLVSITAFFTTTAGAKTLTAGTTMRNVDVAWAGVGGVRDGDGNASISLTGVSGIIRKALLYWAGPTDTTNGSANASITFNNATITGTNLGFSDSNCWGFVNSQAYRADVTSMVNGNGTYSVANLLKNNNRTNISGLSLVVFFDDGNPNNNRDIYLAEGNDSNYPNNFDGNGWDATLSGVVYNGGNASLDLIVADGQGFDDTALVVNGTTIAPAGPIFQGDSLPDDGTAGSHSGGLWDHSSFNITSLLQTGQSNTLHLTADFQGGDCLSLIVAMANVPVSQAVQPSLITCFKTNGAPVNAGATVPWGSLIRCTFQGASTNWTTSPQFARQQANPQANMTFKAVQLGNGTITGTKVAGGQTDTVNFTVVRSNLGPPPST